MRIYLKNNSAKHHPDPIRNDACLGIGVIARNLSWGTPEVRRAEFRDRRPRAERGSWGGDSEPPPHQLGGLRSAVSSPAGSGLWKICILDTLRAQKRVLWLQMSCQSWILEGVGLSPLVPPGYAYVLRFFEAGRPNKNNKNNNKISSDMGSVSDRKCGRSLYHIIIWQHTAVVVARTTLLTEEGLGGTAGGCLNISLEGPSVMGALSGTAGAGDSGIAGSTNHCGCSVAESTPAWVFLAGWWCWWWCWWSNSSARWDLRGGTTSNNSRVVCGPAVSVRMNVDGGGGIGGSSLVESVSDSSETACTTDVKKSWD